MIRGLHHVGLSVPDLDRSIAFYRDVLGMHLVSPTESFSGAAYEQILALRGVQGTLAILALGSLRIELFQYASPRPQTKDPRYPVANHGLSHFCIEVDDIKGLYARLRQNGVHAHSEPLHFPGEGFATYVRDPDGNVIELYQPDRPAQFDAAAPATPLDRRGPA